MATLPPAPKLAIITAPSGARFSVDAAHKDAFQGLINDLEAAGYPISGNQSGGYNPRMIAGTDTPSEHASGRAIDVNWTDNPRGGGKFAIPADLARKTAAKYGLTWGGDWSGGDQDPMHFEVAKTDAAPAATPALSATIAGPPGAGGPVSAALAPPPAPAPAPASALPPVGTAMMPPAAPTMDPAAWQRMQQANVTGSMANALFNTARNITQSSTLS